MDKLLKKVEQMDDSERDHLRQLLKERKKEEEGGKMEWMYKKNKPESEEYLLGRRIDKYVNEKEKEDQSHDKDAPGAIFSEVIAKRADLDMQTKMREDPLYAIRKKEEEARRRLLENPIKMKQLQKVLQKKAEEEKKKKRKKKRKKSKHKKKHSSDDSAESSDDDSLVQKYLAIKALKKHKKGKKNMDAKQNDSSDEDDDDDDDDDDNDRGHSNKSKQIKNKSRHSSSESDSRTRREGEKEDLVEELKKHIRVNSDDEETSSLPKAYGLLNKDGQVLQPVAMKKSSSPTHSKRSRSRSKSPIRGSRRSPSPKTHRSRSPRRGRHNSPSRRRSKSRSPYKRSRSPNRRRKGSPRRTPPRKSQTKTKLSAEEMEKKRQEMMEDAKWRDEQRVSNIERYRKEDAKEKEQLKKRGKEADFISPIMSQHAEDSSVEDRLKRNRYNLQRTRVQMDKSFTNKQ